MDGGGAKDTFYVESCGISDFSCQSPRLTIFQHPVQETIEQSDHQRIWMKAENCSNLEEAFVANFFQRTKEMKTIVFICIQATMYGIALSSDGKSLSDTTLLKGLTNISHLVSILVKPKTTGVGSDSVIQLLTDTVVPDLTAFNEPIKKVDVIDLLDMTYPDTQPSGEKPRYIEFSANFDTQEAATQITPSKPTTFVLTSDGNLVRYTMNGKFFSKLKVLSHCQAICKSESGSGDIYALSSHGSVIKIPSCPSPEQQTPESTQEEAKRKPVEVLQLIQQLEDLNQKLSEQEVLASQLEFVKALKCPNAVQDGFKFCSNIDRCSDLVVTIENVKGPILYGKYWRLHLILMPETTNEASSFRMCQKHFIRPLPDCFTQGDKLRVRLNEMSTAVTARCHLKVNFVFAARPSSGDMSSEEISLAVIDVHPLDFVSFHSHTSSSKGFVQDDCTVSPFGGFLEELNRKHRPALTNYLFEGSNKASEQADGVTLIVNPTSLLGKEYEVFYPKSEFIATLGEFVNNGPVTAAHQCLTPERSQILVTMAKTSSTDAVSVTLNSGLRSDLAISMKKELLRRCLSITAQKMNSESDLLAEDQLRAAHIKNEAAALLRQTREIGYDDSDALSEHETEALLAAVYKRAREKILVLP